MECTYAVCSRPAAPLADISLGQATSFRLGGSSLQALPGPGCLTPKAAKAFAIHECVAPGGSACFEGSVRWRTRMPLGSSSLQGLNWGRSALVGPLLGRRSYGRGSALAAAAVADWLPDLVLGVGVGLPCTVMSCGDVIYRSTLPPPDPTVTPGGIALLTLIILYLAATPGVAAGFWDMVILSRLERFFRPQLSRADFELGKKLGEGAYGTVYKAFLLNEKNTGRDGTTEVVVKRATEYGAAEIWMNERVRRACPLVCAQYIDGFLDIGDKYSNRNDIWLIWKYEGDSTLDSLIQNRNFPYTVEEAVLGQVPDEAEGPQRENRIIQALMKQILEGLASLHRIGIVHRDIKPQNMVFAKDSGRLKIIDLGAAADLRVGINYVPQEFLLDPRYAAPEQYIMSTQTPRAPAPAVAAALSPFLWQLNLPDRFDVYAAGLIMLQMCFPTLRSDSGLIQFNRQLKRCNYDLELWRESVAAKGTPRVMQQGFDILDLDGGRGWDLVSNLIKFTARKRISAASALAHPYISKQPGLLAPVGFLSKYVNTDGATESELGQFLFDSMARSGTKKVGGFTEAQLAELKKKERRAAERAIKKPLEGNVVANFLMLQRKAKETAASLLTGGGSTGGEEGPAWWDRWSVVRKR